MPAERIRRFYLDLLAECLRRNVLPAAVKPNIAFYEAHGLDALAALAEIIREWRKAGVLVVLDAKRGDIGKTSAAYARMAFEVYGVDAITVAPYMGLDSVQPFQQASHGQGVYLLVRTSNPGAADFQGEVLAASGLPLYRRVAEKLADWDDGNLGAVVGATAPRELEELLAYWIGRGREVPCLIPGIEVAGVKGGQGGSLAGVLAAIDAAGGDRGLHLINSSSGINYAHEKHSGLRPAEASVQALEELISLSR